MPSMTQTTSRRRALLTTTLAALTTCLAAPWPALAQGDAASLLRSFAQGAKAGRASFTQVVTAPDGKRTTTSSGTFAFERPGKFRFDYTAPYAQTIVSDGSQLWFHDPDLNQVTVRQAGAALGATPAAILVGGAIDQTFSLRNLPDAGGLAWVQATPKAEDSTVRWLKVGFKAGQLASIELADGFGQRSLLTLSGYSPQAALPAGTFSFTPPAGTDVVRQ